MSIHTSERPKLTLQENALATAMLHRVGDATVRFALSPNGLRLHDNPFLNSNDMSQLAKEYAHDPKESLAYARESLLAISTDDRLDEAQKDERLDRYLDAYFDLTIKLDHAAFPPTPDGQVRRGTPDYIPDGFVDMGGESSLSPNSRSREQIVVDKRQILENYKPLFQTMMGADYAALPLQKRKVHMASAIGLEVYKSMQYDHGLINGKRDLGGEKVKLGTMDEGICRHQGLVFQVLSQAAGLKSRLLKCHVDGGRHLANTLRIDDQWYIFDATIPDYETSTQGTREWRPGAYKIDRPPLANEKKRYDVKAKFSGLEHTYIAHDDVFWHIDRMDT